MPNVPGGYQPDTKSPSARRADYDLLRRSTALQKQNGDLQNRIEELQVEIDAAETRMTALHHNTAWGMVARGNVANYSPYGTTTSVPWNFVSPPLAYTTVVGRRYRITARLRAAYPAAGACYAYITFIGSGIPAVNDIYRHLSAQFDDISSQLIFNGTGIASNYSATVSTSAAANVFSDGPTAAFYIEDVGPVTYAVVPP